MAPILDRKCFLPLRVYYFTYFELGLSFYNLLLVLALALRLPIIELEHIFSVDHQFNGRIVYQNPAFLPVDHHRLVRDFGVNAPKTGLFARKLEFWNKIIATEQLFDSPLRFHKLAKNDHFISPHASLEQAQAHLVRKLIDYF